MNKKIIEYTIEAYDYKLIVLNIGATIVEYSYKGHNICLRYEDIECYANNELFAGSIVGRSAGRIRDAKFENWTLPYNYKGVHNHHGNGFQHKFYDVMVETNKIILTMTDPEGDYPGNANIKIIYSLTNEGLCQEILADSDKPTLFNFTNHSYFNLEMKDTILSHDLQLDANEYTHLDQDMFCLENREVDNTSFDFRQSKEIRSAFDQENNQQFEITRFIDHPFKLEGKLVYSSPNYKLEVISTCDYVVIYAGNYTGDCTIPFANIINQDYAGICFETQHRPGYVEPTKQYYSKTSYKLKKNTI